MPQQPVAFGLVTLAWYAVYVAVHRRPQWRDVALMAGSYAFCFAIDPRAPAYLLASTAVTYAAGILAERRKTPLGKSAAWIVILAHVALIIAWKEAPFLSGHVKWPIGLDPVDPSVPLPSIIIPLGLSFYAFQSIAYVADVMGGKLHAERDPVRFAVFQAFFPKLAAGPIERASGLLAQLRKKTAIRRGDLTEGFFLITWGCVKTFVIAANAALIADPAFLNPWGLGTYNVWAVVAFAIQLYADFSGYTDIARGVSRLLGFRLRMNFLRPFAAASPDDFWKRWHISLSEWVRDYIYIPLGGNRRGPMRTVLNVFIAMILIGLWHGFAWTYVLWGVFHAAINVAYRAAGTLNNAVTMPKPAAVALFFAVNLFGWMIFRSQNMEMLHLMVESIFTPAQSPPPVPYAAAWILALALPLAAVEWWQSRHDDDETPSRTPWFVSAGFYAVSFYLLLLGIPAGIAPFIYAAF